MQLSEDQFSGPKRPIKQQNKQRVWQQEPGQGAKLITRDVVVSLPSYHPTSAMMQALETGRECLLPTIPDASIAELSREARMLDQRSEVSGQPWCS
jgi:hypothetical protein